MPIKVKATKAGLYGGNRIREGQEFFISSEKQLGSWMQRLDKEPDGMALGEAISLLDPEDDAHWTKSGLPNINVLIEAVGSKVTREDVEEAAPGLVRSH